MTKESIEIGRLYDDLVSNGCEIHYKKDYEVIIPKGIKIKTLGNKYVNIVALSRHKTPKHLIKVAVKTNGHGDYDITVTTDHVCMVYNRDHFFENVDAKNLEVGDYVQVYDEGYDKEIIGVISNIEDIGITNEYVYDCEVDGGEHIFYANSVLIHNSQFLSIKNITNEMEKKYNLPHKLIDWSKEDKLKLWEYMSEFVDNTLNKFVRELAVKWCHTEHPEVITYDLEYIGETGLYESKKHYGVRLILKEGPKVVDKIKYSGIELKKASVPVKIKEYLGEIYKNTLTNDWKENDFKNYLKKIYPEFEKLTIDDISFWKGYTTFRESDGFLHMKKMYNSETGRSIGDTSISTAVTYYNQLIDHLKIGDKYDKILLGDKVRFCYVNPSNRFGIKYIAFKDGQYPDEFKDIFEVDYPLMWEKLIDNPLKNFLNATRFNEHGKFNPNNANVMEIDDL